MSTWREKYKVHPAADVFPMMSDEDLDKLAADIKANGLQHPIVFHAVKHADHRAGNLQLIDGRNRLEAMERAGIVVEEKRRVLPHHKDPVAHIIGLNIRRRHLTKQQQADLIVATHKAAAEASRQLGEVPPKRHVEGKAGSEKDATKAAAVADAEKHGISKRTVERSISARERADRAAYEEKHPEVKQARLARLARAKAESKTPKPSATPKPEPPESQRAFALAGKAHAVSMELEALADALPTAGIAELQHIIKRAEELRAEAERIMWRARLELGKLLNELEQGSTLPQNGRSEVPLDAPAPENEVDLGDIPTGFDWRESRP